MSVSKEARASVSKPTPDQPVNLEDIQAAREKEKEKEKRKKRILTPIQIEFPELFRSTDSLFPSYTGLVVPYDVVCRLRQGKTRREYERRFKKEVKSIALQQMCAWDGVRVARIFTNGIRIPPYKDPLKPHERRRVTTILKEPVVPFS